MRSKRGKVLWSKFSLKSLLKHGPKVNGSTVAEEEDESESESDDEDSVMRNRCSSCSSQASEAGYWSAGGQHRRHSSVMSAPGDLMKSALSSKEQFRIFIGTWNVGGKLPEEKMNIKEWLNLSEPRDIYVIGLQEIVPLNAGNVLGVDDDKSCVMRWLQLIHKALNQKPLSDAKTWYGCTTTTSAPQRKSRRSFSASLVDRSTSLIGLNDNPGLFNMGNEDLEFSFPLLLDGPLLPKSFDLSQSLTDDVLEGAFSVGLDDPPFRPSPSFSMVESSCNVPASSRSRYALVASKRMVGIFLSVWVRDDLCPHVRHVKISSVGCGIMGYLGNKGSISISLSLHQTTFCFICSHLTSGEKEGDELRRNDDVSVILKRTRFYKSTHRKERSLPDTILDHDCILWFGDLNYRLTLSSTSTKLLLARGDWQALLERDQLHIERRAGRVFKGWHEGKICFPPTYKYRTGSDSYAVERRKFGEKRRTPAWCDRILWYGKGLKQLEYVRAESNFSDHRPVYAVFLAEVDVPDPKKLRDFLI